MIITPYPALNSHAELAQTAANFPACKFFLPCDETSGTTLKERISGASLSVPSGLAFVSNGITFTVDTPITLPANIAVGTKSALLLAVGNFGGFGTVGFATAANADRLIVSALNGNSVQDGTNTASGGNCTTGAIVGTATKAVPGASNQAQKIESTLTTYTETAAVSATPGAITSIPTLEKLRFGSIASQVQTLYAAYLFVFANGIPADIKGAITWMTANAQAGNKAIYPGWRGLA